jgi:glutamate dehydrogenase
MRNFSLDRMAYMYYAIGSRLDLGWLREQIKGHPVHNNWDALARAAFRDDLDSTQREVTVSILNMESTVEEVEAHIDAWIEKQALMIQRWRQMISALKESPDVSDFTRFAVTLRELKELVN